MTTRAAPALALAFVLGCSSSSSPEATADGPRLAPGYDHDAAKAKLVAALGAKGFDVDEGAFGFFQVADCASLASCYGNNPSSPYGLYYLPPAPGEADQTVAAPLERDGKKATWRLREDEAIVFLGKTPPKARYFGFRSYVFSRGSVDLFASLGDTQNQLVLATGASDGDAFGEETAVITTADRTLDAELRGALADVGAPGVVNTDAVPRDLVKMGLGADADVLGMLFRVALFEDAAAGEAYMDAPPAAVLRVRPKSARPIDPFTTPQLRPRGTGETEGARLASLGKLDDAIRTKYAAHSVAATPVLRLPLTGLQCLATDTACLGDNDDTLYYASSPTPLPDSADDFFVVIGVNHTAVGKATYTNVSVYDSDRLLGVAAVADTELDGTASDYLAGDPDGAFLYAWKFARDCKGEAHCTPVPVDFPGVPLASPLSFAIRPYLEPQTRTGPEPSELLLPRVLRFSKK